MCVHLRASVSHIGVVNIKRPALCEVMILPLACLVRESLQIHSNDPIHVMLLNCMFVSYSLISSQGMKALPPSHLSMHKLLQISVTQWWRKY